MGLVPSSKRQERALWSGSPPRETRRRRQLPANQAAHPRWNLTRLAPRSQTCSYQNWEKEMSVVYKTVCGSSLQQTKLTKMVVKEENISSLINHMESNTTY